MKKRTAIIVAILMICVVGLTACGVPEGYRDYGVDVINYDGSGAGTYFLNRQFAIENASFTELAKDKLFFSYNDELYYIEAIGGEEFFEFRLCGNYSVYKDDGKEKSGDFVLNKKNKNTKLIAIYDAIFLCDNYLYYGFKKCLDKQKFEISTEGFSRTGTYYKNEFYRFDLETGENENIDLALFFEKIHAIDNKIELNGTF